MSRTGSNPAFPEVRVVAGDNYNAPRKYYYQGMTLRDWFAGQALAGLSSNFPGERENEHFVKTAYSLADAMIAEKDRGH